MLILGLDLGTSAVKAAVLDVSTGSPVVPPVKVAYELDHPTPDAAEIPPERFREAAWQAARGAVQLCPEPARIEGVGLSCLMPALVLLDSENQPLSPIWIHLDRRSRAIARRVQADVGAELLATCGNGPLPGGISALCYAEQKRLDPALPSRVRHYLHANGWIGWLLTGERAFDYANASFTGLFDTLRGHAWMPRWCDYFGVSREWLPPVLSGDATLGRLQAGVAPEWGLTAGIPVKLGTADTSSGMLAARLTPDDLYVTVGTTTVLGRLIDHPRPDARRLTRMFGVGTGCMYAAHNPVGGSALPWLMQLCFPEYLPAHRRDEFYERVVPLAVERATEVRLEPPYLGGDRLQIEARKASFTGLSLSTDRMDLLAALLRAMREGHQTAFDALDWDMSRIRRIVLTGGGSDLLPLLLPELATQPVEFIEEGALRGTARLFAR